MCDSRNAYASCSCLCPRRSACYALRLGRNEAGAPRHDCYMQPAKRIKGTHGKRAGMNREMGRSLLNLHSELSTKRGEAVSHAARAAAAPRYSSRQDTTTKTPVTGGMHRTCCRAQVATKHDGIGALSCRYLGTSAHSRQCNKQRISPGPNKQSRTLRGYMRTA